MVSEVTNVIGLSLRPTVLIFVGIALLIPCGVQAQAIAATAGVVQGTVVFGDAKDPISVSGAKVAIYGDTTMSSTVSDGEGRFSFSRLGPGIYVVEATCLGLHAEENVRVDAGAVVRIALQLTPRDATPAKR